MKMPIAKLTRRGLASIKPVEKRTTFYDAELAGFGLRVEPSGRQTYFVEYRPGAGGRNVAKKRYTIGTSLEISPEDARKRASDVLAAVRLGGDPAAERSKERSIPRFQDFAVDTFLKDEEDRLKVRTLANYKSAINRHINPAFGTLQIDKVTTADVARLHRRMGKTMPTTANRMLEIVSSIYRHAGLAGHVPKGHNPAADIAAYREEGRERFLSADELARLGDALALAESDGLPWKESQSKHVPKTNQKTVIDRHACDAIRLLILTGLRLREVLNMKWADIDFERGVALLPDTKTGRRYAVLSAPALTLLQEIENLGDYVIRGDARDKPRHDLNRPWRAIRAHAGLDDVRIHDLRHSFASVAASGGVPLAVIGKMLGHASAATTQRYAHLADDPLKAAADTVAGRIAASMTGRKAEVIPMRKVAGNE
ncbi:phage integrase family protein [Brucella grignonensis]|uniref:Phage integrase family protein n=2 Tax=Brucella grignonensis TaxID=94627 RepID=A0A256FEL6_9HYPH|nr:tyrosine-type recombinase/integrase [Brucella grignonensis]OYR13305.1 phage integrase family protein [Brucella grignonensis]